MLETTAYTTEENIARLDINVRSGHGDISLPRAQTTPQPRGAFPYLNHDLFLSNSMRELNAALGQLQYRINTTKHYNTQVKKADGSAREPDLVDIAFDKTSVNVGRLDPDKLGDISVFRVPVHILATNDAPEVLGPSRVDVQENALINISGVSIVDVDADEVLLTESARLPSGSCPPLPGEAVHVMAITIQTVHGHVFVNDTGIVWYRNVVVVDESGLKRNLLDNLPMEFVHRLLLHEGDTICGLDDLPLCIDVPAEYFIPRPVREKSLKIFVGPTKLTFGATLSCANGALRHLRYRGNQDYNNNVASQAPSDRAGCALGTVAQPSPEFVDITADDQGYTGCVKGDALQGTKRIEVMVQSIQQALVVRGPENLATNEDVPLAFSSHNCDRAALNLLENCGSPQVLSRDNGDVSILSANYEMTLAVDHGTLMLSQSQGITFRAGDGKDDKSMVLYGPLCALNRAIRSMTYTPDADFNTQIKSAPPVGAPVGSEWRAAEENLLVSVKQLSGPTLQKQIPIDVRPIDDPATISFMYPGETSSPFADEVVPQVVEATSDIYFCGGAVTCTCPPEALACVKVEDVDACEAKWTKSLECNAEAEPAENPTLIVEAASANLWFYDSADLARTSACSSAGTGCATSPPMHECAPGGHLTEEACSCRRETGALSGVVGQMNGKNAGFTRPSGTLSVPIFQLRCARASLSWWRCICTPATD